MYLYTFFFLNRPRVLHLYIGHNFELVQKPSALSHILNEEKDILEGYNKMIKGLWLVPIKPRNNENEEHIQRVFQSAPLRFDSLVFAYHKGMKSKIITNLSLNE